MEFIQQGTVGASMVGSDEGLSVIGAFQIVEDGLTAFFGSLGIDGVTIKRKYGAFWVFVKSRVRFIKKIFWNDEYTVEAWISLITLAKLHVDVCMCDKHGDRVFEARVELCALDIAAQRIKRLAEIGIDKSLPTRAPADIAFGELTAEELPLVEQVTVRSTNIDHSHHTNNLEYLRFIMNTYSVAQIEARAIREVEIVYASQSYEGDVLSVQKAAHEDRDLFVLQKSGKPVVKCEITF